MQTSTATFRLVHRSQCFQPGHNRQTWQNINTVGGIGAHRGAPWNLPQIDCLQPFYLFNIFNIKKERPGEKQFSRESLAHWTIEENCEQSIPKTTALTLPSPYKVLYRKFSSSSCKDEISPDFGRLIANNPDVAVWISRKVRANYPVPFLSV